VKFTRSAGNKFSVFLAVEYRPTVKTFAGRNLLTEWESKNDSLKSGTDFSLCFQVIFSTGHPSASTVKTDSKALVKHRLKPVPSS